MAEPEVNPETPRANASSSLGNELSEGMEWRPEAEAGPSSARLDDSTAADALSIGMDPSDFEALLQHIESSAAATEGVPPTGDGYAAAEGAPPTGKGYAQYNFGYDATSAAQQHSQLHRAKLTPRAPSRRTPHFGMPDPGGPVPKDQVPSPVKPAEDKPDSDKPRRPVYDPSMPNGLPTYAWRDFLYKDEKKRICEIIVKVQLIRAQFSLTVGDNEGAIEHATNAGETTRSNLGYQPLLARCSAWRGRAELRAGRFEEAIESLEEGQFCRGRYIEGEWVVKELAKARMNRPKSPKPPTPFLPPMLKTRWRSKKGEKLQEDDKMSGMAPSGNDQPEGRDDKPDMLQSETDSVILESDDEEDGYYRGKMTIPPFLESSVDTPVPPGPATNPLIMKGSGFGGHTRNQSGSRPPSLNLSNPAGRGSTLSISNRVVETTFEESDGEVTAKPTLPGTQAASSEKPENKDHDMDDE